MSEITAKILMNVYVECPSCKQDIDLRNGNNDEEGYISDSACKGKSGERHELDVNCTECDHEFTVHYLEWV